MRAIPNRARVLVLAAMALGALVLLAAGLPDLQFRPGQRFVVRTTGPAGPAVESQPEVVHLPTLLPAAAAGISISYLILFVLVPAALLLLILSPKARKDVLKRLVPFLIIGALWLMSTRQPELVDWLWTEAPASQESQAPVGVVAEFERTPPNWLVWVSTVGLVVTLALVVGGAAWWLWRRRREAAVLEGLAAEAESALDALRAGAQVSDAILRCYFEMSQVVSSEREITRGISMTPREFEARMVGAGLPGEPVRRLTRLFEAVRYGAKPTGETEAGEAMDCLAAIVEACRKDEGQPW